MQQFTDGTFGAIEPANDLLKRLCEAMPDNLKAVHFGSLDELEKVRNPPPAAVVTAAPPVDYDHIRQQVDDLAARVNELTMQHHQSGVRVYPETALHRLASANK
jgi:hypothetical protein